jgi:hypothetical protein
MLRLIGVLFLAIVAQFIVHGWSEFAAASGDHAVQSWKNDLARLAEIANRE